jgi:hypothetical protein
MELKALPMRRPGRILMGFANRLWGRTKDYLFMKEEIPANGYGQERMLELAKQELESAYNLFARAEDPDMIEYAVFNLKATEKRYDYLIKRAKQQAANPKMGYGGK